MIYWERTELFQKNEMLKLDRFNAQTWLSVRMGDPETDEVGQGRLGFMEERIRFMKDEVDKNCHPPINNK